MRVVTGFVLLLGMTFPDTIAGQNLLDRPAHLDVQEESLEVALLRLSRESGVAIAFSPDLVRGYPPVTCLCSRMTIREALDTLLASTNLEFETTRNHIIVRPKSDASSSETQGDDSGIHGVIRAASDGQPIPSARVGVVGRIGEVFTEPDGSFGLSLAPGTYDLMVRAMGYRPVRTAPIRLDRGSTITLQIPMESVPVRLDEIIVTPSTYQLLDGKGLVSPRNLTRDEIETRPHLGEDIFRAVDRLPGVATHDITAKFHIRGGSYDQVLTTLDGLELYSPFHLQDIDGALSIIDVESVQNVDLITGGFDVQHGDRLAGVFSMETTVPPPDRVVTTLGLSVQNATVKNQGSFPRGQGSWLFSARRGYLDLIMDITNAVEDGVSFSPRYYDLFGKVQYLLGSRHMLAGEVLHAVDDVSIREEDGTRLESAWRSSYAWLTWNVEATNSVSVRTILSSGRLSRQRIGSDFDGVEQVLALNDRLTFPFYGIKQDWNILLSDDVLFRWGFDLKQAASDYDYGRWHRRWIANTTDPAGPPWWLGPRDTLSLTLNPSGRTIGVYLSSRVRPLTSTTFELGLRYDHATHIGDHTFAPRVNAAIEILPRTTVRGAWGHYYQSHRIHELRVADGEIQFGKTQRAEHRIVGLQHDVTSDLALRIEGYERRILNPLPEYRNLVPQIEPVLEEGPEDRVLLAPDRGLARGIEVSVDYGGDLSWRVNYALGWAKDLVNGQWLPRPYDQRHALQLELAYRPTPTWSFSWAWQYHSAWPSTAESYALVPLATGDEAIQRNFEEPYASRLRSYHRLDARVMRQLSLGRGTLSVFLDVFNIYDRKNVLAWEYFVSVGGPASGLNVQRDMHQMIGVLPTVGARWEF